MTAIIEAAGDPDEALRLAQCGDHDAFARLIEEHEAMVFSIALHFLGDRTKADDVAQDVFVRLYRSVGSIQSSSHLLFWLRQVTARRCIDEKRRFPLRLIPLDEVHSRAAMSAEGDPLLDRRLRALVTALPDAQRIAITLRYQEDLDPAEICGILGMPVRTVKSHLYRGLRALRKKLGDL
jgi:RNA polymerase sigma-70 factor, ECF subfamily